MHKIIGLENIQPVQCLHRQRFVKDFLNAFLLKEERNEKMQAEKGEYE